MTIGVTKGPIKKDISNFIIAIKAITIMLPDNECKDNLMDCFIEGYICLSVLQK